MADVERCPCGFLATAPRCPHGCRFRGGRVAHVEAFGEQAPRKVERPRYERRLVKGRSGVPFIDLTGQQMGTWFVIGVAPSSNHNAAFYARHECGEVHVKQGIDLRRNPPKKCTSCRRASQDRPRGQGRPCLTLTDENTPIAAE